MKNIIKCLIGITAMTLMACGDSNLPENLAFVGNNNKSQPSQPVDACWLTDLNSTTVYIKVADAKLKGESPAPCGDLTKYSKQYVEIELEYIEALTSGSISSVSSVTAVLGTPRTFTSIHSVKTGDEAVATIKEIDGVWIVTHWLEVSSGNYSDSDRLEFVELPSETSELSVLLSETQNKHTAMCKSTTRESDVSLRERLYDNSKSGHCIIAAGNEEQNQNEDETKVPGDVESDE